jgi:hypothetical protein
MTASVQVKWNGAHLAALEKEAAKRGLYLWAEEVLTRSGRLVPKQEGTLQDSGVAHRPGSAGLEEMQAAVSYDTPYAVRQHEEMDYHHTEGRQAKYLETPLNASKDVGLRIVANEIKKKLGA